MKNAFTLSATFPVQSKIIYAAWLSGKTHGMMTGEKATASSRINGTFTAWDGYISGRNLDLEPGSRIVQSWRTAEFAETDPDSRLEILLKPSEKGCTLTLKHSNLPPGQSENYRQGWKDFYLIPMKRYFSSIDNKH